jgi:hypothetical protein
MFAAILSRKPGLANFSSRISVSARQIRTGAIDAQTVHHFPPIDESPDDPICGIHHLTQVPSHLILNPSLLMQRTTDPQIAAELSQVIMEKERRIGRLAAELIDAGIAEDDARRIAREEVE